MPVSDVLAPKHGVDRMQRAVGRGEIVWGGKGLERLFQSGCVKILLPRIHSGPAEAVIVNTSGGVTGGDRLDLDVRVQEGGVLCVTSQAAEKVYRSSGGAGTIRNRVRLGARSVLDWLPQETILFDGSALSRKFTAELEADSRLLALETLFLGRRAMGESLGDVRLRDQWRIFRQGRLVYGDCVRLGEHLPRELGGRAGLDSAVALANLIHVAPDAGDRLGRARELLSFEGVRAAASAWNGLLLVRFVSRDAWALRNALGRYLEGFRGAGLPRVWSL